MTHVSICISQLHRAVTERIHAVAGLAPAILDWYGHCMRESVNKLGGSGGMLPHEIF